MQIFGETGKYANECLSNIGKAGQATGSLSSKKKRNWCLLSQQSTWASGSVTQGDPGSPAIQNHFWTFLNRGHKPQP